MTQRTIKMISLTVLAGLTLAGCQKSICDATLPSDKLAGADQMLSCLDTLNVTPVAMMPNSGSATYNGYFAGAISPDVGPTDSLIGDAVLTANFTGSGGSVAGKVTNVSSTKKGALGKSLAVTGGAITANTVTGAAINGTLTGYGNATTNITISGLMAGGFLGDSAQGLLLATGVVTPSGTITSTAGMVGAIEIGVFGMK